METASNAVQHHLACALTYLVGHDETTTKVRQAVDTLIEAAITAEPRKPNPKVMPFPRAAGPPLVAPAEISVIAVLTFVETGQAHHRRGAARWATRQKG